MTVDGVIVPESEWKTKKIAGVLKFLLVHRHRLVSKDQLMEVFCPGLIKSLLPLLSVPPCTSSKSLAQVWPFHRGTDVAAE